MIRLGIRLATSGGRGAAIGLALTALAVATGTAILLFALSFPSALDDRTQRSAWRSNILLSDNGNADGATLLMYTANDAYQGEPVVRVLLAPLVDEAPVPPGIDRLPAPGEAFVSPALAARIAAVPADQLGDRFGTVVGTIDDKALRSPQELVAIIGETPATMTKLGASPIQAFATHPPTAVIDPGVLLLIIFAVVGALAPVVVFVSTATQLSAARREQRLAALRLVGATSLQVTQLAAIEAFLATIAGVAGGIFLFIVTRPLVALIPLDEATWFPSSITPPIVPAIAMLATIPVVGVVAAVVALRRVVVNPLGVQRRQTPPMPGLARAIPLLISLAVLVGTLLIWRILQTQRIQGGGNLIAVLVGAAFGGVVVGIVLVGPWLTALVGRALRWIPAGASTLLASRRLTDDPRGSFGSIAGVIMAVFVASAFFTLQSFAGTLLVSTAQTYSNVGRLHGDQVFVELPWGEGPSYAGLSSQLSALPGVTRVLGVTTGQMSIGGSPLLGLSSVVSCADFAHQFDLRPDVCPAGRGLVSTSTEPLTGETISFTPDRGDRRPIQVAVTAADLGDLGAVDEPVRNLLPSFIIDPALLAGAGAAAPPNNLYVDTDGSSATAERIRTILMGEAPAAYVQLATESPASGALEEFGRVVGLGLIGSLILAGCSLAIAVTTGILDRRRQFALLRSAGMPVSRLRALVLLQAGAPLVTVALFSAVLGIGVVQAVLRLVGGSRPVPMPDGSLVIILGVSLLGALGVVALMLPPLERLTRPDSVRME